jgi:hypothetical protein
MSYLTISNIAADQTMRQRVAACAAQEGVTGPEGWAQQNSLTWAAAPGWADAWEYAVAADNQDPGADPAVITDAQILSQVQSMLTTA